MCTICMAQKKPLDHSVYDSWQTVANTQISTRGNYIAYEVNPQEGDGQLVIHPKRGKDIIVPRGHQLTITPNEQYAFCLIRPLFNDTRQAKIKKKKDHEMPRDTLAIIRLAKGEVTKIAHVASYKTGRKANDALAYISADTTYIPKKERANKNIGKPLFIHNLKTNAVDTFRHVDAYHFDKYGRHLAMTLKEKKDSTTIAVYHMDSRLTTMPRDDYRFHSLPTFDEEGTQLLFVASADTLSSGSKHCDLFYMKPTDAAPTLLIDHQSMKNLPDNWGLTQDASPFFSHDGRRIFAGVAEYQAPKDTTLVPFETAGLDIWNWDAPELPPMMKANLSKEKKRTSLAVYLPDSHQLLPLTTSKYDRISRINRGDAPYALSADQTKTIVETQWNMQNEVQLSLVDLSTGRRTPIASGCFERAQASPEGHFVTWYDLQARQWMLYNVARGETRQLTADIDVNWWDEDDDHPMMPEPYGLAGWTQGDRDVMVYDRYDIWKIPVYGSGRPVCLTAGEGRRSQRTFRYINVKHDDEARYIAPKETMLLSVFDHQTKQNGYATVSAAPATQAAARPPRLLVFGDYDFAHIRKAEDTQAYIYQRGNFQQPMDLYAADATLAKPQRLSAINPQQSDYNWGTAELYHWTAYDGTRLDGLLYKPENFDPQRQYPLMIYFYERRSETLFSYIMPQPSWSTVNITFYVSRGYVVFVPDIVYPLDGLPGEAAYNCVCSGAESLISQPWIDRHRVAIQGQSWGGYQVAYLITRTNMFCAAGAGAPVANMTSAYGGIRWESGMSRQFQYEQSQSRVGKPLWDAPDLYLKNSPLFGLPRVTTPVLIMHNDNDGAVPWYQGIEMFMGLRRLQKPAWLLEYNNEAHNLKERRNRRDLTIRMQQFFDHYMLNAPMPAWMKHGVPTMKKGQYFGLENADAAE